MRIDNTNSVVAPTSKADIANETARLQAARRVQRSSEVAETDRDQVVLGHQSSLLARALQAAAAERQARTEELRLQVQAGTYYVDAQELGRAIVQEMLSGEDGP